MITYNSLEALNTADNPRPQRKVTKQHWFVVTKSQSWQTI
jgi:hypothetical protein